MLGNSLAVAALDVRILRRDPAPVLVMTVVPLLFVPFLMPGARAQLVDLGHLQATGAEYAVPGLAILFSLLNAQQVITAFFREQGWGTWHRLRIAPVPFPGLIVGKSLTALAAQCLQLVVVLVGGGLLFGYRPNGSPIGVLVVAALFSAVMVCFGMLLFALCRTENQALTLSNIVAMAMAGFGGTFGPVTALPAWMQAVAPASPAYWALDAITALSLDGAGLRDVLGPVAGLVGFAALFLGVAALAFRRQIREA
ncbi:MAG TPA: ABC transporter permease [Ruania sp.]|nr:ABC transporter permease [Ruania sp.]